MRGETRRIGRATLAVALLCALGSDPAVFAQAPLTARAALEPASLRVIPARPSRAAARQSVAAAVIGAGLGGATPCSDEGRAASEMLRAVGQGAGLGAATPGADEQIARMPAALRAFDPGAGAQRGRYVRMVAMARALDEQRRWSSAPEWLAIMGWSAPLETPATWSTSALDQAPGRYPVEGGKDDPALDLRASIALAWTTPNFSCRFPLRARFLEQRGLAPTPLTIDAGGCPEFEAFARPDRIESIELLFTAQSWGEAATTAGHVLFKVHESSPTRAYNEDASRTFSYAVNLDRPENQENLIWRGLIGEAKGEIFIGEAREVEAGYRTGEQRDIYVYRLELTTREKRDLMALFWVQAREGTWASYYFFSVNCARLTYDALRTVLPELPRKPLWFMHPHEIVALLGPYLSPLGVQPSRRRQAIEGERRREQLDDDLESLDGFSELHQRRWASRDERVEAMETFAHALEPDALTPQETQALAEYLDAIIDIEVYDIDMQQGFIDNQATSPLLEATIDVRARLPPRATTPLAPPTIGMEGGGSRRLTLRSGVNDRGQPVATMRTGIIDEQPGEPFAVSLNRHGRNEFLVSELSLRMDGLEPRVDEIRTILLSTANYSEFVRTTVGWWRSHSGFVFDLSMQSLPSRDIYWGTWVRVGQSLSLVQSSDHLGLLVIGADLTAASWMHAPDYFRGGLGVWLEASLPFDAQGAHRLWVSGRAQPTFALDVYVTEVEVWSRLDFTISQEVGCVLGPYFELDLGRVLADQWQAGLLFSL